MRTERWRYVRCGAGEEELYDHDVDPNEWNNLAGDERFGAVKQEHLRERAGKMDYSSYRRLRMPIGGGITEAACKIAFTQRFKQSVMKWTIEGGRPILALRVIHLSGIWEQVREASLKSYTMPQPVTPNRPAEQSDEIPLNSPA